MKATTTTRTVRRARATIEHGSKPMSEAALDRMEAAAFLLADIPTKSEQLLALRVLWRFVPRSRRGSHWLKRHRRYAPKRLAGLAGGAR